jgi:hypothetical protein
VTDWDDMVKIWEWVYGDGLKTLSEDVGDLCWGNECMALTNNSSIQCS